MPRPETDCLEREVNVFCRYLIGQSPDEYVTNRYRAAHEVATSPIDEPASRFDELLVRIASMTPALTRLADSYASVFDGRRLRRKLVLLLGILENSPSHFEFVSAAPLRTPVAFLLGACGMVIVHVVHLLLAMLTLLPLRLVCRRRRPDRLNPS